MSMNPVPYRVEVKPTGQHFFEVIAAFNDDDVAKHYATQCQLTNEAFDYRVTKRRKVLFDETYITGNAILERSLGAAK